MNNTQIRKKRTKFNWRIYLERENINNKRETDASLKDKEIKEEYLRSIICDIRDKWNK